MFIINIYEYYNNLHNKLQSEKYMKYYIYINNCNELYHSAKDYINKNSSINNIFTNNGDAYFTMAYYFNNDNDEFDEAFKYFILASEYNNDCASHNIAMYYEYKKNKEQLLKYLLKSIDNGNIQSICKFILLNKIGHFNENLNYNCDIIINTFNTDVYYHIGCYFESILNYRHMIIFLNIASNKNHIESIMKLATYYNEIKNYTKMVDFYKRAVNLGNIEALKLLAEYYKTKRYYKQMVKYYKLLSLQNDTNAFYNLGLHYSNQKNEKKMIEYFEKASILGHYFSQYELEQYYILNNNTEKLVELYKNKTFNSNTRIYELYSNLILHNEKIWCPIKFIDVSNGFKTKCAHYFSYDLLLIKNDLCPLCRSILI